MIDYEIQLSWNNGSTIIVITRDSHIMEDLSVTLRAIGNYLSLMTFRINDPNFELLAYFPDPATTKIDAQLIANNKIIFSGLVSDINPSFPPHTLTITAHDKSIELRRNNKLGTMNHKTCMDMLSSLISTYGFTIEADIPNVKLESQILNHAVSQADSSGKFFSDWDRIRSILAADGLEAYVNGTVLKIRQMASKVYPITFEPGKDPLIGANFHIGSIEKGTAKEVPSFSYGSYASLATILAGAGSALKTSVGPVKGQTTKQIPTNHSAATINKNTETNISNFAKLRKDDASITTTLLLDYTLDNIAQIKGFSSVIDSDGLGDETTRWHTVGVHHLLISPGPAKTNISLMRGKSKQKKGKATAGKSRFHIK